MLIHKYFIVFIKKHSEFKIHNISTIINHFLKKKANLTGDSADTNTAGVSGTNTGQGGVGIEGVSQDGDGVRAVSTSVMAYLLLVREVLAYMPKRKLNPVQ